MLGYNNALDQGATATANFLNTGTGNAFMNSFLNDLNGAPATMGNYKSAVKSAEIAQKGLTASIVASKVAVAAFNIAASVGISIAVSAIVKFVDNLVHSNEKAIESADKLRSNYEKFKDTNASNIKTINGLRGEFQELSKGVSQYGDNISLTTDQYDRYREIIQQIVNMSPSLAEGYSTSNGYIADKNGLLERAIELQEQEYRNELRKMTNLKNLKTSMSGYVAEYKETSQISLSDLEDVNFTGSLYNAFNASNRKGYNNEQMARDILNSLGVEDINSEIEKFYNDNGNFESNSFFNEYADTIAKNIHIITNSLSAESVGLDKEDFDKYVLAAQGRAQTYIDLKDSSAMINESIQKDLYNIAEYTDEYSSLSTEQQKFVNDYLKTFSISDISSRDFWENLQYDENKMTSVKSQIIDFVKTLSKDDSTKLALTDLYASPKDNQTVDGYVTQVKSALELIKTYCEDNGIEIPLEITNRENDIDSLKKSYDSAIKNANTRFKSDESKFFEDNSINTQEEIDNWLQIVQSAKSAADAEQMYLDLVKSQSENPLSSTLSSYGTEIDNVQSKTTTLLDIMDKLNQGQLSESDVVDLLQMFPELAPYVDLTADRFGNLATGIKQLANSDIMSLVSDLNTQLTKDKDGKVISNKSNQDIQRVIDLIKSMDDGFNQTTSNILSFSDAFNALNGSHDLVQSLKSELDEFGSISIETIEKIAQKYPDLQSYLIDYQAGILSTADIYKILTRQYDNDLENYKRCTLIKKQYDNEFYSSIVNSDLSKINQFNSNYGVDISNCKNYASAKLKIEQLLLQNVSGMWATYYDTQIDTFDENLASLGMTLGRLNPESDAYKQIKAQYDAIENYKKAREELDKISLSGITTDFTKELDRSDSGNSISTFFQEFDWAAETIKKLSDELSKLQAQLDYSTAYQTQIDLIDKLISKQKQLTNTYSEQSKNYKTYYDDKMSSKYLTTNDKKKITSGAYTLQTFKGQAESGSTSYGENRYNAIVAALEAQSQYTQSLTNLSSAKQQLKEYSEQLASVPWEYAEEKVSKLNSKLELLEAELNNTKGYEDKNKKLEEQLDLQEKIVKTYQEAVYQSNELFKQSKKTINSVYNKTKDKALEKVNSKNKQKSDYNSDGTLKTKGVSKDQKKSIEEYNKIVVEQDKIANSKKVSVKGLTGDALVYALEYNASLDALKTNTQQLNIETEKFKSTLADVAKQEFDNITSEYDNRRKFNDARISEIQSSLDLAEAKGHGLDKSYYEELISKEKSNIKSLKEEKSELTKAINQKVASGEITYESDIWYEMMSDILDVDSEIRNAQKSVVEFNNAIQDLNWSNFDTLLEKIQGVVDESNFLIELMSSKKLVDEKTGEYTAEGLATQGQHAINYDVYMSKADEYKQSLDELDKQYSNDKYNKNYLERREELLNAQQDSILAAENEKQAMIDLAKEGITAQVNSMEELINKKKEAIDLEKELYDRQKNIAQKTKAVGDIQKQINALQGDNSEENRRKLQELKNSLTDAQTDLKETQDDYSREDQKKALDEQLNTYRDNMEVYSNDTEKLFQDTMNIVNSSSNQISSTIAGTAKNVGYQISSNITNAWKDAGNSVEIYSSTFSKSSANIIGVISSIKSSWDLAKESYEDYANSTLGKNTASNEGNYTTQTTTSQIKDILGKSSQANGESNNGTSALNKYAASLGYSQLSYEDMVSLAKVLGIKGVNSVANVSGDSDKAKSNRTAIKDALQKKLITDLLNSGTGTTANSGLNQYVTSKGYKALSYNQMAQLGRLLEVDGVTLDTVKSDDKVREKIKTALQNASFSQGGIPELVKGTGEDGVALVKRGEPILTQEQGILFKEFISNIQPLNSIYDNLQSPSHIVPKSSPIVLQIDSSINVDGVATNEIVKDMSVIARKQVESIVTQINNTSFNKGVRYN